MDKRTFEIAESTEADFSKQTWTFAPTSDEYRCGAGLYLLVPIKNTAEGLSLARELDDRRAKYKTEGAIK